MRVINDKIHTYDVSTDEWREITPQDVENFENCAAAFGLLRERMQLLLREMLEIAQGKRHIA